MKENRWLVALKGLIVGATMIVPGVSGGTMAIILGIYDSLIASVSSFAKNIKENLLFLMTFACGTGIGIFLFSAPISWLLEHYQVPTLYFFVGAVVGGIPLIEKKSGIKKISPSVVAYLLLGAVLVIFISRIPGSSLGETASKNSAAWMILLCAGIISAAALILPGISFSHFLLILGLYDRLLNAIRFFELGFLFPLGLGVLLGVFFLSKILETFMVNYPKQTYLIILGFIIGSVVDIFPGIPVNETILVCSAAAITGFFITYRNSV